MEITSGVLRVRYHLYNKITKLEENIVSIEKSLETMNEDSEEYSKSIKCLEYSNENLRKQIRLYKFLSDHDEYRFINLKKVVSYIVVLYDASIVDIVECLCYAYNKNYNFFMDDSNIQYFIESHPNIPTEKSEREFFENQLAHRNLREYLTEDNKVTKMKELTYEEFQKFKDVGFTKKAAGVLIDTALRNYEYEVLYELKRELKI